MEGKYRLNDVKENLIKFTGHFSRIQLEIYTNHQKQVLSD